MNRLSKILLTVLLSLLLAVPAFAAWDATQPDNDEKLRDVPSLLRANFAALQLLTDPSLCITNAKVCAAAGIVDTKLATITTASKVSGSAIYQLGSVPVGGGQLPIANGGTNASTAGTAVDNLLPSQGGNSGKALITNATTHSWGYPASLTVASAATGDLLYYNGSAWVRLAAGTTGFYLKAAGASAPVWTDILNTSTGTGMD
jgi:hypothetical protein